MSCDPTEDGANPHLGLFILLAVIVIGSILGLIAWGVESYRERLETIYEARKNQILTAINHNTMM